LALPDANDHSRLQCGRDRLASTSFFDRNPVAVAWRGARCIWRSPLSYALRKPIVQRKEGGLHGVENQAPRRSLLGSIRSKRTSKMRIGTSLGRPQQEHLATSELQSEILTMICASSTCALQELPSSCSASLFLPLPPHGLNPRIQCTSVPAPGGSPRRSHQAPGRRVS